MRSLFLQISVLIGALTLATDLGGNGNLAEAGLASLGSATAMYLVLVFGDRVVQRALDRMSPESRIPGDPAGSAEEAASPVEAPKALAA